MADSEELSPSSAQVVAEWAGLPCDEARAARLHGLLVAQKERMQRFYDEDVAGFEFDFLMPRG
ncbi:hypothetical protein EDC65_0597 [Stella humosa]|uniref:Uncharacterized protein n=1 Tax=Stella humosa TaxID=94 RepID=A0A3N1MCU2_9PROT|nr:hypothetical protein [Stella humosa]ROQ01418.1 hypothetical protein EDC65_0597 [Stella humosa]BBK31794.1 hypothetical protein STHU_24280 [Stella humosa]